MSSLGWKSLQRCHGNGSDQSQRCHGNQRCPVHGNVDFDGNDHCNAATESAMIRLDGRGPGGGRGRACGSRGRGAAAP
eukprot:3082708-Rhodomonas_salina.4